MATDDADALHRTSYEPSMPRHLAGDKPPVQKAPIRDIISGSESMYADEGIGLSGVRWRGRGNLIGIRGFVRREGREKTELAQEPTQGAWGKCIAAEVSRVCLHQEKASSYRFQAAGLAC